MTSNEEEISTKQKLSKLNCPFTWELLVDSTIRYKTICIEDNQKVNDNVSCPLELLINSLFQCYIAVIGADNDTARRIINETEEILMEIQQEYDIRNIYIDIFENLFNILLHKTLLQAGV